MNTKQRKQLYLDACSKGDINTIQYMIKNETKYFRYSSFLFECLCATCKCGDGDGDIKRSEVFKFLLDYEATKYIPGTSNTMSGEDCYSHMMKHACEGGNIKIINIFDDKCNSFFTELDSYSKQAYNKLIWNDGLMGACISGNIDTIRYCLTKVKNVDYKFWNRFLLEACKTGDLAFVELCSEQGANDWDTCLLEACKAGYNEIIKFIIGRGRCSYYGLHKSLYYVSRSNNTEMVELIINEDIYLYDHGLEGACEGGHMKIIEIMISKGAKNWQNGMEYACKGGNMDIVKFMISKGIYNVYRGFSSACEGGNLELVEFLVNKYANDWIGPNNMHISDGFISACKNGHSNIVKYMITKGYIDSDRGYRGFDEACIEGRTEIVGLIINLINVDLNLYIRVACKLGHIGVVKLLIEHGANDFTGCMYEACERGCIEITELLIANGDTHISSGLRGACNFKRLDLIKLLLKYNNLTVANFNEFLSILSYRTDGYMWKYHIDENEELVDIMRILVSKGANNLELMALTKDIQIYTMLCKINNINCSGDAKYLKLLQEYPPYMLFVNRNNSTLKKLPVELFRHLFFY